MLAALDPKDSFKGSIGILFCERSSPIARD